MIDKYEANAKHGKGDILFYIHKRSQRDWAVRFGTVIDFFADKVELQNYEPVDRRLINNIPVKDFPQRTEWKKLPKGWRYDTELYKSGFAPFPHEDDNEIRYALVKYFRNDCSVKQARLLIDSKVLVPVYENEHCKIDVEINSTKGYCIYKNYMNRSLDENNIPDTVGLFYASLFETPEEAKAAIEEHYAEFDHQATLSDYDWSVEQIDDTLDHWAAVYGISEYRKNQTRDYLMSLGDIENLVVRISEGNIQWRYGKNKRWVDVEI